MEFGRATSPPMEERLMIEPRPAAIIGGAACFMPSSTPSWLTRKSSRATSAVVSSSGAR